MRPTVGDYALLSDSQGAAMVDRAGPNVEDKSVRDQQVQSIPWKRAAKPWEIGRLALFLASSDADYVTGATFDIDGGVMQNQGQGA